MPLRGAFPGTIAAEYRVVQLGSEPGLQLHLKAGNPRDVDPEAVHKLLAGSNRDLPTGVTVRSVELEAKFFLWSTLPRIEKEYRDLRCALTVHGASAGCGIAPYLFGFEGKHSSTSGLLGEECMAVWVRPPGQPLPREWPKDDTPFELHVRSYGPDSSLAELLVERARTWDAAGRPPNGFKVRAYSKETDYTPSENEIVVERQYTRFVIEIGS